MGKYIYTNTIENKYYKVYLNSNGFVSNITNKMDNMVLDFVEKMVQYNASDGEDDTEQPSGAYIFRPKQDTGAEDITDNVEYKVMVGEVVSEIFMTYKQKYNINIL